MKRIFIAIIVSIVSCQLLVVGVNADSQPAFSLSINPSVLEIQAQAPANPTTTIALTNKSDNDINLQVELRPFKMLDNGQIQYLSPTEAKSIASVLNQHVKILDQGSEVSIIKLAALETKQLTLDIKVDQNTPTTDYYFTVLFTSINSTNSQKSNIAASGGIGTNVILSLSQSGPTMGHILEFSAPFIFTSGPVPFKLLLGNDSNHYIIPRGHISIKNMLGKTEGRVDILPEYLLANSSRYLIDSNKRGIGSGSLIWPEKFLFGIYQAKLTVNMSDKGPVYERSIYFIAFPLTIILGFSLAAFVVLGIMLRVSKKMDQKSQNIIN